ncbi:hypothetical protein TUM17567_19160 [Citrobacter amalonaticus]|nr:hypothetical protein TUM17567_19160 [Citrobacter amalonaticus]
MFKLLIERDFKISVHIASTLRQKCPHYNDKASLCSELLCDIAVSRHVSHDSDDSSLIKEMLISTKVMRLNKKNNEIYT